MFPKALLSLLLVFTLGVGRAALQPEFSGTTLRLVTHDSFLVSDTVLAAFQEQTGITIEILYAGDAGTMLNQMILTRENPVADVLYGVDNTFLSRALEYDLFIPYEPPQLAEIPEAFVLDPEHRVTPIDFGDVCLNYDVAYFTEHDLEVPDALSDLTDPVYRDLLVVQNPASSSPGLAFLLTTIAVFGEDDAYDYLDYWADLVENDVNIVDDWNTAYFGEFTAASEDGSDPLVVSYASSPPAEVLYAEEPSDTAPTAAITADDTCFRQIEFAGILRGTPHEAAAQAWIDFMLSREFQEDLPLNMFVFPVLPDAELPEVFETYAAIAETPVVMGYQDIEANRETWIEAWSEAVLR